MYDMLEVFSRSLNYNLDFEIWNLFAVSNFNEIIWLMFLFIITMVKPLDKYTSVSSMYVPLIFYEMYAKE